MLLILLPFLLKAHLVVHAFNADAMVLHSGLAADVVPGWRHGLPSIDPNIGFTSQALGHRAALDLLHGRLPWWNPYEGIGMPMAGEMQSAALFPLTPVLALRSGQLYFHLLLQVIAGLSTFFLLRRVGCGIVAALAGGVLFQVNGTFAWLGNAVVNPVPFLPLILYGVETARSRVLAGRRGGWFWISVGLALSLSAGFPETAYLNGLLVLCWFLVRAAQMGRPAAVPFILRVVAGGTSGLLIAAPVILAFFDYLQRAFVGGHVAHGFAALHLAGDHLLHLFLPYVSGGIFESPHPADVTFWSNTGGYAGTGLLCLALAGVGGRADRPLKILLAVWAGVTIGASFGMPVVSSVVTALPGVAATAFYRYFPPSWELCLSVLAAFAVDALANGQAGTRWKVAAAAGIALASIAFAASFADLGLERPAGKPWMIGSAAAAVLVIAAMLVCAWRPLRCRSRAALMAAVVVAEAAVYFVLPTLTYPRHARLELSGVRFLEANLGLQRFYTLAPILPNYGAFFGIASINHNDLPLPEAWVNHVRRDLDDNTDPILFTGFSRTDPKGPTSTGNFFKNLPNYQRVGVKYLVTPAEPPFDPAGKLLEIHRDKVLAVYEVPSPRPYFAAEHCRLEPSSRERLTAECDQRATLTRLELAFPGWRVFVNGIEAEIAAEDGIFQQVVLPAGASTIEFRYLPPYTPAGYAAFALGLVLLIGGVPFGGGWPAFRGTRRPRH